MQVEIKDRDGAFITMDVLSNDGPIKEGGHMRLSCGTITQEAAKVGFPPYLWYEMLGNNMLHGVPLEGQSVLENAYQQLLEMEKQ